MAAQLHFTKNAFALHFLFKRFERLIDIIVTDQNLHVPVISCRPIGVAGLLNKYVQ